MNGDLTANFKSVAPNAPMSFSNVNGKIDVTLPGSTKANLKLKSDRGGIYSDFEMAVDKTAKPTTTAQNGVHRISQESWTSGRINGGGAEITMKSLQGNLERFPSLYTAGIVQRQTTEVFKTSVVCTRTWKSLYISARRNSAA